MRNPKPAQMLRRNRMRSLTRHLLQAGALAAAALFLIYGVSRGEAAIVLNKAIHICMECIGLG